MKHAAPTPRLPRSAPPSSRRCPWWLLLVALLGAVGFPTATARAADLRVVGLSLAPSGAGTLRIELLATVPVVGVQIDLLYPASQATLGPANRGGALGTHVLAAADVAPGRRRFLVYSTRNQPLANGVLAEIPLAHVGAAAQGTFPLLLTNAIVSTPAALPDQPVRLLPAQLVVGTENPPTLSGISFAVEGLVRFNLRGAEGRTYQVQSSVDLLNWTDLQRATVTGGQIVVEDRPSPDPRHRFYRARLL